MPTKSKKANNMKIAGLFVALVIGLIIISLFFKTLFLIKNSKFDGNHKFNIALSTKNGISVISFSPSNKSITTLLIREEVGKNNLAKSLGIPIDGQVFSNDNLTKNNLSFLLLKSVLFLGSSSKDLTIIDLIRLSLFSRTVSETSIYEKEFSNKFNDAQKSTIISLAFTDPNIYEENQIIEVVNATNIYGLGGNLANLVSNIGGNVVLVSSADKRETTSKIIYSGKLSYTAQRLSSYLNYPLEKKDKKNIFDVIIIIGEDKLKENKF